MPFGVHVEGVKYHKVLRATNAKKEGCLMGQTLSNHGVKVAHSVSHISMLPHLALDM